MASPLASLNRAQLNRLIEQYVSAAVRPQRQELANRRRRAVETAKALAQLQRGVGPATGAAYQEAARTQGALAQGVTGEMRRDIEADAAAAAEALSRIGAPQAQIDKVSGVGAGAADAAYVLGGLIPGGSLAHEGAAFAAAQNQLPATTLGRGQYEVAALDREERELDETIPKLRAEVSNQLIGQELSKAELALRQDAQSLYEAQFSESVRHHKATESAASRRAAISERNYNLAVRRHELAISNAEAQGRKVDKERSKHQGVLVDVQGRPILDANGKKIKFKGDGKRGGLTPYQQSQQRAAAVSEARDLRGEPVENPNFGTIPGEGKYLKRGGGTTNDPKKAQRDSEYGFEEAIVYIMEQYNVSRSKARSYVIAAGYRPPPKRRRNRKVNRPGSRPG